MGSRRSRFTILLALLVATAAAYVAFLAIDGSDGDGGGQAAAVAAPTAVPLATVLVAKQDIPAGTTVTAEMVEERQVAPDAVSPRALTDPEAAVGMRTAVALTAGEQVLDTRLTAQPTAPRTFAREVPAGLRALSLVFTEIQGFGGMAQPGDYVNVVAYFEIDVDDVTIDEPATEGDEGDEGDEAAEEGDDAASDDEDDADKDNDEFDYTQYVSVYVVQNVEVLAVAQALRPEAVGVTGRDPDLPGSEDDAAPEPRPDAQSVTLAVTPEQAQRLMLATHTAVSQNSGMRLLVRAPGDTTIYDLPPAQLGEIPLGGLLGDINVPLTPTELLITDVEFTKLVVSSGEILEFKATVKNVSDRTIPAGGDAPPEYVYTQGQAYDDLGFFGASGTYRIGLNVAGAAPTPFPYRWGLGRDLAPGESTTIVGAVQLTEPIPDARYWLGMIQEPDLVTQDGVAVVDVTVLTATVVTVQLPTAQVLAAPDPTAAAVQAVAEGERLGVLGVRGPWYHVRIGDDEGWIAANAIAPLVLPESAPSAAGTAGAVHSRFDFWR